MSEQETVETVYDYHRYKKLLAEAVDEIKRLELIDVLIQEKARDRLEAQRMSDRVAMTAQTIARVLGTSGRRDNFKLD
jgi:protein-L-isoaspartate O-methyltransferase